MRVLEHLTADLKRSQLDDFTRLHVDRIKPWSSGRINFALDREALTLDQVMEGHDIRLTLQVRKLTCGGGDPRILLDWDF